MTRTSHQRYGLRLILSSRAWTPGKPELGSSIPFHWRSEPGAITPQKSRDSSALGRMSEAIVGMKGREMWMTEGKDFLEVFHQLHDKVRSRG